MRAGEVRELRSGMGQAAGLWVLRSLALMGFVLFTAWMTWFQLGDRRRGLQWMIDRFWGADTGHFKRIAEIGYPKNTCCDQAFMPGYPVVARATRVLTGGDTRLAMLVVTAVAGIVMAALLWRLAAEQIGAHQPGDARAGGFRALTYLMVAPYGVFFVVGYAETLFLAVAIGAWLAGLHRRWWLAGLLSAAAIAVRVNGLFLVAALGIMYLIQAYRGPEPARDGEAADGADRADRADRAPAMAPAQQRPWWRPPIRLDILAFGLPVIMLVAVAAVLHRSTGSWNAWQEAEVKGWNRHTAWPWDGLADGYREILASHGPHILVASVAAFATVIFGMVLLVVFAWLRRWPETTFMLLNVLALVCSTTFVSAPRYGLGWFPAYILFAELTGRPRWRWLHWVLAMTCLPFLAGLALLFSRQAWVA